MLSNVLEVLAVLHENVGKAGNRPADVDDGEDDDGDLGTKILSSVRLCFVRFSYQLQHIRPAGTFLLSQKLKREKVMKK